MKPLFGMQVYTARHSKAELEEQDLWEKWQTLRTEAGKQIKACSSCSAVFFVIRSPLQGCIFNVKPKVPFA